MIHDTTPAEDNAAVDEIQRMLVEDRIDPADAGRISVSRDLFVVMMQVIESHSVAECGDLVNAIMADLQGHP